MPSLRAILACVLLSSLGVACAPADRLLGRDHPPYVREVEPTPYGPAEVSMTGGLAGAARSLRLSVDGSYTRFERGRPVSAGRLTPAEHARLRRLLTSVDLAREAVTERSAMCSDGFEYRVTMGRLSIGRTDCGAIGAAPTLEAIIALLGSRLGLVSE